MTLYELSHEIRAILDRADALDGELTDDDLAELDALTGGFDGKVQTYCCLIREADAEATVRRAEEERFRKGRQVAENRARRLKLRLLEALQTAGTQKVEAGPFRVRLQNNPASLQPTIDTELLPEQFQRVKVEPDCAAAKEYYQQTGQAPEGFQVITGQHVRIS